MRRANFTVSLFSSLAVAAVAVVGMNYAVMTRSVALPLAEQLEPHAAKSAEVWQAASGFLLEPVHEDTVRESTGEAGRWFDDHTATAIVGGQVGELIVTRNFGSSEDADVSLLRISGPEKIQSVTIGFRPAAADQWFWARYDTEGNVERDANGRLFAGYFDKSIETQCVADAWSGMASSS